MNTFSDLAARFPQFTEEEHKALRQAMEYTWSAIASDCIPFMDDEFDEASIVELIVDAGRMNDYGAGWGSSPDVTARKTVITRFYEEIRADFSLYPSLPTAIWRARWR